MNILKRLLLILIFTYPVFAFPQSASEADALFSSKQFSKAKTIYQLLIAKKPTDQLYNYRLARCCYETKDYESAVRYFESCSNRYPMRDHYLADSYFQTYRFTQAAALYEMILNATTPENKNRAEIQIRLSQAQTGESLLNRVEDIALIDSIVVSKNDFMRYYRLSQESGKLQWDKIKNNSRDAGDKITYTTQRGDRKILSDTTLKNKTDIFSSYKLLESWTTPSSISDQINSTANENYPFLLLDGVTLYFASDRKSSLGGYDIFVTKFSPNAKDFLAPENIGFPFNSPYNDYMYAIDDNNKKGWFASDRFQPAGKICIYIFAVADNKNYIHTQDSTLLRQYAQLKKVNKASFTSNNPSTDQKNKQYSKKSAISFVINDSIIYTRKEDFKNQEALHLWEKLIELQDTVSKNEKQLDKLRYQYAHSEISDQKEKFKTAIIELEKIQIDLNNQVISITKNIRYSEINSLKKN